MSYGMMGNYTERLTALQVLSNVSKAETLFHMYPPLCDSADWEIELEWESIYILYDMVIGKFRKSAYPIAFAVCLH